MKNFLSIAVAVATSLVSSTNASHFSESTSKLQVRIPKSLSKEGGYNHSEALFGIPFYGASLEQNVYYADSDLCSSVPDTRGGYPARPTDSDGRMMPWPSPFILMVDRGKCAYPTQVRNAQHAGAAGVIVADNRCLCTAGTECKWDPGQTCENHLPIVIGSSAGGDITIPSFLMLKQDADRVKAELVADRTVRIEMSWPFPAPDARVEYDLWTTPTDAVSRDFLSNFRAAAVALGQHAYFTPYMYIFNGYKMGCEGNSGHDTCHTRCTNNGRYCATDPGAGADVVRESLRRACAWNLYGKDDGVGVEWWDYIQEFNHRCSSKHANEECVKDAMIRAKMDYSMVQNCMRDSGGLEGNVKNSILEEQLAARESFGIIIVPATYVNRVPLHASLNFVTVFNAICAGFIQGSAPEVCQTCAHCGDPMACVNGNHESCAGVTVVVSESGGAQGRGSSPLLIILMIVAVVGGVGLQYFVQRARNEMRDQVRGIVAQYIPLQGQSGDIGSPADLSRSV